MMRTTLLCLAILITGAGAVKAQVLIVAADLAEDCRHQWPEAGYFHCAGYLTGVLQSLQSGLEIRRVPGGRTVVAPSKEGSGPLCVAAAITPDGLAKGFVRFVDQHPEKLQDSPLVVAAEALIALDEVPPQMSVAPARWENCGRKGG
jgi:Rap1a immunity proteins